MPKGYLRNITGVNLRRLYEYDMDERKPVPNTPREGFKPQNEDETHTCRMAKPRATKIADVDVQACSTVALAGIGTESLPAPSLLPSEMLSSIMALLDVVNPFS